MHIQSPANDREVIGKQTFLYGAGPISHFYRELPETECAAARSSNRHLLDLFQLCQLYPRVWQQVNRPATLLAQQAS